MAFTGSFDDVLDGVDCDYGCNWSDRKKMSLAMNFLEICKDDHTVPTTQKFWDFCEAIARSENGYEAEDE